MPWKDPSIVETRMELLTRLRAGERVTDLAREYGVSRKTIYKFKSRVEQEGALGLNDRSRRPERLAKALDPAVERAVLQVKKKYPTWGARKIRAVLPRRYPGLHVPAASTVHEMLKRNGAVVPRKKRHKTRLSDDGLTKPTAPNHVWAADFKGQFRTGDGRYCYPLTATDLHSRFLLLCEALPSTEEDAALAAFTRLFLQHGLPEVVRTDNGVPFASAGYWGLSRLSTFWIRLGIHVERIERGQPQQNGCHERMHRTLKLETARPSARHLVAQQEKFDTFEHTFNNIRPHESLDMEPPASRYRPSTRVFTGDFPEVDYPLADDVKRVDRYGQIRLYGRHKLHLSTALQGHEVAIAEQPTGLWTIGFCQYDLGAYDPAARNFVRHETLRPSSLGALIN